MHTVPRSTALVLPVCLCLLGAGVGPAGAEKAAPKPKKEKWIQLFNGKDLGGWKPKIRGYPLGDNHLDTFRVENGVLKVSYDKYQKFEDKFGHLAYHKPFSRYRIRIEYRFLGEQVPGGPGWALRNSGVMLHGQAPESMGVDQRFPVSIEAQFLGGNGSAERPTGNMCSPGTHVVMDGKLTTTHCINSKSKTYHGDQWVTFEAEVRGGGVVKHMIEGETVIAYGEPQLDDTDKEGKKLLDEAGGKKIVERGYIYLQAESHPIEFRKVELLVLGN